MMNDIEKITSSYEDFEIPKSKLYLTKYFTSDIQRKFLKYYLLFGDCKNFESHTGISCSKSLIRRLEKRVNVLIETYESSKKTLSEEGMEMVYKIETGKFNLSKI